ncbi:MAG TPA: Gfo/Idh/MocA family oxidoreductase [Bryobacteraceae bacterium]|nr:Gfo/Idh/MocA family oxidoreductase [Bryobacteraceae bacterium]
MRNVLKGGIIGCGFFAERHIEAWRRIPEVEIVAAADPRLDRAQNFAPKAYESAEEMLERETLDFVDIVTRVDTHRRLVRLAVARRIPVICQKPFAPDWPAAVEMVESAESAGVPLMVHENWRWQRWYRVAHEMISRGDIGALIGYGFRTRTQDGVGDEPYPKQAYFRQLRRFLIDEVLVHHIDTARFLFGEIESVCAQTSRRNCRIAAEDQGILILTHEGATHGWIDGHRFLDPNPDGPAMGDAFFEGELGAISIPATGDVFLNNVLAWKNDVTVGYRGDSVRATEAHFISCLKNGSPFESGGRQYLRTFAAVEAAYRSSSEGRVVGASEILQPGG